ncbi:MAG: alanine racemase [Christensenellaceae bacterium]
MDPVIVVDLSAIRENALYFRSLTKAKLIAVVKANAYGHGAVEVSHALKGIADLFAVATVDEGVALRLGGIGEDILVLTPPLERLDGERAREYGLILSVPDLARARIAKGCRVHLQVNTGMNRYGAEGDIRPLLEDTEAEGLYSHLGRREFYEGQYERFLPFVQAFRSERKDGIVHFAATEGTLTDKKYHFDGVRIGIGLYGYAQVPAPVRPAMKAYGIAVQSRRYAFGSMGYFKADSPVFVSAVRGGYADGFLRENRYGMDAFVTEGEHLPGERVLLFDDAALVARRLGTIPYEVLSAVGRRARYEYR